MKLWLVEQGIAMKGIRNLENGLLYPIEYPRAYRRPSRIPPIKTYGMPSKGFPFGKVGAIEPPRVVVGFAMDNRAAQRFDSTNFCERIPFRNL